MKTLKRNKTVILIATILLISFYNCKNTEKNDFISTYRIDKTIPIDTSIQNQQKIDSSYGWVIYLSDENIFEFKGSAKTVKGIWQLVKTNGSDHFIDFQFENKHISGRLNDNIIYFDKPNLLFDSIFKHAIFVRLRDN